MQFSIRKSRYDVYYKSLIIQPKRPYKSFMNDLSWYFERFAPIMRKNNLTFKYYYDFFKLRNKKRRSKQKIVYICILTVILCYEDI